MVTRSAKRRRAAQEQVIPTNNESESSDIDIEISRSYREILPAHYLFKISSFAECSSKGNSERFESDIFQASGYKWKLDLYPNGNGKENGKGHISLYLVIAETDNLPHNWEVYVNYKLFVYDHIKDRYLTIQDVDGKVRRFHAMKTEWGFGQLLSLQTFNDASNGYLREDCCVFGAEVFVITHAGLESSLMIKETSINTYTWKIDNFSTSKERYIYSEIFVIGGHKWKLLVYPKGNGSRAFERVSLYLESDYVIQNAKQRLYAEFSLQIRNQVSGRHVDFQGNHCFCAKQKIFGFHMVPLKDLHDATKGFLVNDTIILEVEILGLANVKNLT